VNEQIDIAAIRARVAAATPGPWVRGIARDDDGWAVLANGDDGDDKVCVQPSSRVIDPYSPAWAASSPSAAISPPATPAAFP
jgi:hypothetical protein